MMNIKNQISRNFFKAASAILILASFAYLLMPFLPAMIMGGILALALSSLLQKIESRGFTKKTSLNILMAGIFLIFLAPTLAFLIRGSALLTHAINDPSTMAKLKEIQDHTLQLIDKYAPSFGISLESLQQYIDQGLATVTHFIFNIFSNLLGQIPDLVLFTLIMILSIYFFLFYEIEIRQLYERYFGFQNENGKKFLQVLKSSSREVFLSNVLTGILQASVVTIGAAVFQMGEWFLIFFVTFIASFIPVIGAGPVAFLISLYSFAVGDNVAGIGMLVISVVSGTADNIIRPYLASLGEVEVPGIISFLAVIGGVITMGLPGLFLGPLIASLVFGALPILIDEFFPKSKTESMEELSDQQALHEIE